MKRLIVVGGGPAGMMAAIRAAEGGVDVTLLDRNEKLGKKLYITGKGRCNLTNNCDRADFFAHIPHNARFLYSAYAALPPQSLMAYVESLGVPLVTERGNRVFPASQKSSDILRALERAVRRAGVTVRLGARVQAITQDEGGVNGVTLADGERLAADWVILALGGASYPATGSTGDGYALARALGHAVLPPQPSLTPMETEEDWCRALQGLALKNVRLTVKVGKKVRLDEIGEVLFTHFGVSGPLILKLSSLVSADEAPGMRLSLDLKPGLTPEQLDARLLRDFAGFSNRQLGNALSQALPHRMVGAVLGEAGLDPETPVHQLTQAGRRALGGAIKGMGMTIRRYRGMEEAVVTRGGVSVKEVDPKSMASKVAPRLSIAGELLDVDGMTGGYNLQIAFSTGWCAGTAAAEALCAAAGE